MNFFSHRVAYFWIGVLIVHVSSEMALKNMKMVNMGRERRKPVFDEEVNVDTGHCTKEGIDQI